MQSALNREYRKMYRNLNGIRTMNRLPECLVVFDPKKEKNAIREARKLGITTVALIDTDCDPDEVDLPIPGNDDGIRSIELIVKHLADAVLQGKATWRRHAKRGRSRRRCRGTAETAEADAGRACPTPAAGGPIRRRDGALVRRPRRLAEMSRNVRSMTGSRLPCRH